MNEQLKSALGDVIKALTDAVHTVGSVAKEQLPLLVREYLRWGAVDAGLWIGLQVVLILVVWKVGKHLRGYAYEGYEWANTSYDTRTFRQDSAVDRMNMGRMFGWVIPSVVIPLAAVAAVFNIFTLVEILVAPRVYLLEQLKELIK